MNFSLKTGFSFGLTSGIITTLGLMVGLHSGTRSEVAVLGGILVIAIADAFSDALGIHIAQESKNHHPRDVWQATLATFTSKFIFALTFVFPVLLFDLPTAILVSIVWGLLLLGILSFLIAKQRKVNVWKVVGEHLLIGGVVIILTHYLGDWISRKFG